MPLYEYHCPSCNARFEILQKIGEGAEGLECPECGAEKLEKQFSTFASTGTNTSTAGFGGGAGCGGGSGFS